MIAVLMLACVSIPLSIMSIVDKPVVNNYYYNNTTIINNNNTYTPEQEHELTIYPLIENNYVFCNNAINHEENTEYKFYNYTYNATNNFRLNMWIFQNQSGIVNTYYYIYDMVYYEQFKIVQHTAGIGGYFMFPYTSTWLIVFETNANLSHSDSHVNITFFHQVREIY